MITHDYAKATLELIHDGTAVEKVLSGLTKTTERRGHRVILPAILREVLAGLEKESSQTIAEIRVANEKDVQALSVEIKRALDAMGETGATQTVVDTSIIGGVVIRHKDKIVDASYKKQLLTVYRALTK